MQGSLSLLQESSSKSLDWQEYSLSNDVVSVDLEREEPRHDCIKSDAGT